MPIEAELKENLIKEILLHQGTEKLRLIAMYKHLAHTYDEDQKYNNAVNHVEFESHEKIKQLANKAVQIMKNQVAVDKDDLNNLDEFFTKEEQESEAFQTPANDQADISDFWMNLLLRITRIKSMISDADLEVLKHLEDVQIFRNPDNANIRVEFSFRENEFFTNKKLVVESVTSDDDEAEILNIKSEGIDWKPGKNVAAKYVLKKPGNEKGKKKATEKEIRNESFFWIFKDYNAKDFEVDEEEELADYDMEPTSDRCLFDMACEFIEIMTQDFLVYFIPACYGVKVPKLEDDCFDGEEEEQTEGSKPQDCKQQ